MEAEVLLPGEPLKRDSEYEQQKNRILCRKRAAIEPIIGHLKHDFRLQRNWLKGSEGDAINLLMAACAWNMRKWMIAFFLFEKEEHYWLFLWHWDKNIGFTVVHIRISSS